MELSNPPRSRRPVLPLLALGLVAYLNIMNRCADGYCYTYGWPWVAYYGWSDAGFAFDGTPPPHRIEWPQAVADLAVGLGVIVGSLMMHVWWSRRRGV